MRAGPRVCDHALIVGGRKTLVGGHECSTQHLYMYAGALFFHAFLKFKRGMPAVSSMTTQLRKHMLRIYSVVILVLTIKSLKMKQMIDFFCLAVVERVRAELISK